MKIKIIETAPSTNTLLKEQPETAEAMTMVVALTQTAGRGQRGNYWEAEPGKNLTFSFYFHPKGVLPSQQFCISEAVALALTDALDELGVSATVKWPNDIYVGDRKISGILIENSMFGQEIARCIVGVGLNVNQKEFKSDAPNPVSLLNLTGRQHDLEKTVSMIGKRLEERLKLTETVEGRKRLHEDYLNRLWRHDGRRHPFVDAATGERFEGRIETVEADGHLLLIKDGETRSYAFKEVTFLIHE